MRAQLRGRHDRHRCQGQHLPHLESINVAIERGLWFLSHTTSRYYNARDLFRINKWGRSEKKDKNPSDIAPFKGQYVDSTLESMNGVTVKWLGHEEHRLAVIIAM
jgi:hypothetical protein